MKIYTSYFSNVKNLPPTILPIAICGKAVSGWAYPQYKKLAPSWSIYDEIKNKGGTQERYIQRYNSEILGRLSRDEVLKELENIGQGYEGVALICYEKPGSFCHRHLAGSWLGGTEYGEE